MPDTAARIINRATEMIRRGQAEEALALLRTVEHDERSHNALGVACYMTGRRDEALQHLRRAAANGNPQAAENLRQIEEREKLKVKD